MAEQYPILLLAVPLFAALFCILAGRQSPGLCLKLALGATAFSLWCGVSLLIQVAGDGPVEYFLGNWREPFGVGIQFRIDLLNALVLVAISSVAFLTAIYSTRLVREETRGKEALFYSLYLLQVTGLSGMTITADAFNLFVLLEVASLTGYGLIAMGASRRGTLAAFNYVIMGTIGASFYLIGVGYLYIKTGALNMIEIRAIIAESGLASDRMIHVAFILMTIGVWIKMAFFPLYGWLPNAYTYSPSSTGALIAPLTTKVSVYVMIRILLSVFGADYAFETLDWGGVVVWLAVIAILAGSILALAQTEFKRMLCYLIVAEVGYMVGGVWLENRMGVLGAVYHIVSDAAMTLCLFLAAGIIIRQTGGYGYAKFDRLFRRMPVTMAAFCVGAFSMIGIPPTCGFFSKWYLIQGAIEAGRWEYVAALLISSLINAILFFKVIEIAFFGAKPAEGHDHGHGDHGHGGGEKIVEAPGSMLFPLLCAAALILFIGIFNTQIADLIGRALDAFPVVGTAK